MSISADDLRRITKVSLPNRYSVSHKSGTLAIRQLADSATEVTATAESATGRSPCRSILIKAQGGADYLAIEGHSKPPRRIEAAQTLRVKSFAVRQRATLDLSDGKFLPEPVEPTGSTLKKYSRNTSESWRAGIRYRREITDDENAVVQAGLRTAQLGALHAVSSHWTLSGAPATVVMPTGTGKTEVMVALTVAEASPRTLVIVPTDPLRQQTAAKFETYGILKRLGVVPDECSFPVVGVFTGCPQEDHLDLLAGCNIVVSTMSSLDRAEPNLSSRIAALFSHIYFDEAHHVPAASWARLRKVCKDQRILQFTATPFREDGKKLSDKIIYEFPLSEAQRLGYYRKIRFVEVFEPDEDKSDLRIAYAAVERLESDLASGHKHVIMARASTQKRADWLFEEIYSKNFSRHDPVLIHSGVSGRRQKLESAKALKHRIIVCVDMFGEGFDLPNLKIAALHDVHKSIGITLQFTGRFTRARSDVGDASVVANTAQDNVPEALEGLYSENADWNVLMADLSFDSLVPLGELADFVDNTRSIARGTEERQVNIALQNLRPKTSAVVYKADNFRPEDFRKAFRRDQQIFQPCLNTDSDILVFVVNQKDSVDWAQSKELMGESWDLYVAYYDRTTSLLFLCSSRKTAPFGKLAKAISTKPASVNGEQVFRALSGLRRLILHNVGLTSRSKNVRYRMYAGLDVRDAINPPDQINTIKANVTGVGYEEGLRKSVGCSYKGKIWSLSSSSVPEWCGWCREIGRKLVDDNIKADDFLKHTLIPVEASCLPDSPALMVDWPDQLFMTTSFRFKVNHDGREHDFHDCQLGLIQADEGGDGVEFKLEAGDVTCNYRLTLKPEGSGYEVKRLGGPPVHISALNETLPSAEFFTKNPPVVRFANGSQLSGNILLEPRTELPSTFEDSQIKAIDWKDTNLKVESRWKDGVLREKSIQNFFLIHLSKRANYAFLIDDDDQGESADIVAIKDTEQEIMVELYHCKYSGEEKVGARVGDLYEVCGQAQKSIKWTWSFRQLVDHIKTRETAHLRGRPTRFFQGTLKELLMLRRASRRKFVRYRINIVQPGISKSKIPVEHLAVLGSTDTFVRCVTNSGLQVYASN